MGSFKIILNLHSKLASVQQVGGYSARSRRRRRPMKPDSATPPAVRPKDALSGAGGAGAAGGRAARGAAAEGRSTAASQQTRMAYYRMATGSHAEKSCSGAGGAGAAAGRVVSGAEAEGRSRCRCERANVRDVERADLENRMRIFRMCRWRRRRH
jgi:hypothetical protein